MWVYELDINDWAEEVIYQDSGEPFSYTSITYSCVVFCCEQLNLANLYGNMTALSCITDKVWNIETFSMNTCYVMNDVTVESFRVFHADCQSLDRFIAERVCFAGISADLFVFHLSEHQRIMYQSRRRICFFNEWVWIAFGNILCTYSWDTIKLIHWIIQKCTIFLSFV